jgi:hypothetical protein
MKTVEKDDFIIFKNTISSDMKFGIVTSLEYSFNSAISNSDIIEVTQFNENDITKIYYNNCYKENILENYGKINIEEFCSKYPEYFI